MIEAIQFNSMGDREIESGRRTDAPVGSAHGSRADRPKYGCGENTAERARFL